MFEYEAFDLPNRLLFFARNNQSLELFNFNMINDRLEIFEFFEIYCKKFVNRLRMGISIRHYQVRH